MGLGDYKRDILAMNNYADYKKIRIGQINILNSQEGEAERYALLQKFVKKHKIEILTVQEISNIELMIEYMSEVGLEHYCVSDAFIDDCVAVFSLHPIVRGSSVQLTHTRSRPAALATIDTKHGLMRVMSAHFPWGGDKERDRLEAAMMVDKIAKSSDSSAMVPFVLGADLNSDDGSRTVRYLQGQDVDLNNFGACWTDAYKVAGSVSNWATSDQGITNWNASAKATGIFVPSLLPQRRLDYLMTHGWNYGKKGSPLTYERFGEPQSADDTHLSDHYGILTDILMEDNQQ